MTDAKTLLEFAARCRRMAARCTSKIIARKFEALALDYEEHARRLKCESVRVEPDAQLGLLEPQQGLHATA